MNRTKYAAALLLLSLANTTTAQTPKFALKGAYTDYFSYFTPGDANLPAGADGVSKGIALLTTAGNPVLRGRDSMVESYTGSAFIIQTFRNDDTLCVCTAGHVVEEVFNRGRSYTSQPYHVRPFNMYLDYLGKPQDNNSNLNEVVTSFKTPLPIGARIVEFLEGDTTEPDIALFLVDKKYLPAVADYAMIGYDLTTQYQKLPSQISRFYQIGHPNIMPQRITKDIQLVSQTNMSAGVLVSPAGLSGPRGIGPGTSGSPFIIRALPDGTINSSGTALAVHYGGNQREIDPIDEEDDFGIPIYQGTKAYATELSTIAAAIKAHCWKAKTEAELEQTKEYMRTVIVNNNVQPYSQSQTLNQAMDLLSIAAPNCYTVTTATENSTPINATYLKAATCSIGSFSFPTVYAATGKPWQINLEGKELVITPTNATAFSYDAANAAELNLASVIVEQRSVSARTLSERNSTTANEQATVTSVNFVAKPNPSTTGHFSIDIPPATENQDRTCDIIVSELATGKIIKRESAQAGSTWQADLGHFAKGAYLAAFYRKGVPPGFVKLIYR